MALCEATSATSLQMRVWIQIQRPELWDYDVNGFSETDFIQSFRVTKVTFSYNVCFCLWFPAANSYDEGWSWVREKLH